MTSTDQPTGDATRTEAPHQRWLAPYAAAAERAWLHARDHDEAVATFLAAHANTTETASALVQFSMIYFWRSAAETHFAAIARSKVVAGGDPDPHRRLVKQLVLAAMGRAYYPCLPRMTHHAALLAIYEAGGDLNLGWEIFRTALHLTYTESPTTYHDVDTLVVWAADDLVWRHRPRARIATDLDDVSDPRVQRQPPTPLPLDELHAVLPPEELLEAVETARYPWGRDEVLQ